MINILINYSQERFDGLPAFITTDGITKTLRGFVIAFVRERCVGEGFTVSF